MSAKESTELNYIITETGRPSSNDPLDADQTQNLPVARMLFATPVELDAQDRLKSPLLESFSYDVGKKTMIWKIKPGVKFSDGSDVTTRDIELAVTRMIHSRPSFPVIDKIEGVSEWLKSERPLESRPSGIQTTTSEIRVRFLSDVDHPLVRFSLELFSVIPSKCIDTKTGQLTCKTIPSSGPYAIELDDGKSILFKKRDFNALEFDKIPERIRFQYVAATSFAESFSLVAPRSVATGNEVQYSPETLKALQGKGKTVALPAARFAEFQINPTVKPFEQRTCRLLVAEKFRENFKRLGLGLVSSESSIFTKLLPGYMSEKELKEQIASTSYGDCEKELSSGAISWGYVTAEKKSLFNIALEETLRQLKIPNKPIEFDSKKSLTDAFCDGKIAFMSGGSGFWAFDPAGDLQMLFTPNLHKPLRFLSEDAKLQSLISTATSTKTSQSFKAVNEYIYAQGLFNVYAHARRFYWSPNPKILKSVQFGNTAPSPWQVFE